MIRISRFGIVWRVGSIGVLCVMGGWLAAQEGQDLATLAVQSNPAVKDAKLAEFFAKDVRPLLKKHCWKCHGNEKSIRGDLSLLSREDLLRGGDSGSAISLEAPDESLFIEAIHYESFEMPPAGKLPAESLRIFERWVKLGAPWTPGQERAEPRKVDDPIAGRIAESVQHWAYQPIRRPPVPALTTEWGRSEIDAFIWNRLQEKNLAPNGPASKTSLLRRAYYNLTGLPPSPQAVREFLADDSARAFERVVDELLESPQYGEHWARHWLDLVRYAETNSYERDSAKPFVWRYRDYVVRSFNSDKPYDQFIREQLAGDELQPRTADSLIATGYYRLGIWDDEPVDRDQALYDELDDVVSTTGQVFLAINIGCARCHEHKIDPLYQEDYYRFLAFFNGVTSYGARGAKAVARNSLRPLASAAETAAHAQAMAAHREELASVTRRMEEIEAIAKRDFVPVEHEEFKHRQHRIPLLKKRVPKIVTQAEFDEYVRLHKRWDQLNRSPPQGLAQALCVTEIGARPRDTHVLIRGNAHAKGKPVEPGFPHVLQVPPPVLPPPAKGAATSGRRKLLADWIASPDNPLTARVIVNRIWQHHFGRGLARNPSDFGVSSTPPTHPPLLDHLASELIAGGWKLKRIHRMIMLSDAYRTSSQHREDAAEIDPGNDRLWRYPLRRLGAESIRDSILAVSGKLNLQMGGPSIYTTIPAEVLAGQSRPGSGWGKSPEDQQARRTIYVHVKRSLIVPLVAAFDGADTDTSCPERFVSTQPTQALLMLNSDFIRKWSRAFAADLARRAGSEVEQQVREGLWRVLQRTPTQQEVARGVEFIERTKIEHGKTPREALEYYCLLLLNLNEFLYFD